MIAILITVIFKVTGNYSRIWLFSNFIISVAVFLVLKVIFDFIYSYLIKSNSIQRNVLIVGDAKSCQNIIEKFPKKIDFAKKNWGYPKFFFDFFRFLSKNLGVPPIFFFSKNEFFLTKI